MLSTTEINDLRQAVLRGETVSPEKLAEAIKTLRGTRISASASSAASRAKKVAQTPEEAEAELNNLLNF